MAFWRSLLYFAPIPLLFAISRPAFSQPIVSEVNGTETIIHSDNGIFTIEGGRLSGDGGNLFHSFERFGLDAGQIANFLSAPNIHNILGRVVGGDASIINGLIQVTGGNSHLFLMNPAGIVFGANASLNVPGDFVVTTATGIGFGSDRIFYATGQNDYTQLAGTPTHFDFALDNPAPILNAGNLAVGTGNHLMLSGGTVVNIGQLNAPGGKITIAAVPGTNRLKISQEGVILTLEPEILASATGEAMTVTALDLPALLVGAESKGVQTGLILDGGEVRLASGQKLHRDAGTAIIGGSIDVSEATSGSFGGTVGIFGDRIGLFNAAIDASGDGGGGKVWIGGEYQGQGDLPTSDRVYIDADSTIRADALSEGNGGRVIVWADDVTGFQGNIFARGGVLSGDGGFVEVSGKDTLIFQGFVDVSATNGANGTLLLDPTDITIHNTDPDSPAIPLAGALADSILTDAELAGAVTISQATLASLMGDIRLEASNNIIFNNSAPNFTLHPSATSLTLVADADNDGVGNVDMQLNALIDTNGADLTFIGENIVVRHIDAGTGKITLNARDRVTFNLSATISTQDLTIRSDRLTIPTGIFAPTITGTGNFALETETASRDIILGGSGTTPTALDITTNDLQTLQTGFTSTTIGRSDGTGTITISDADSLTASTHIAGAGNFVSADRDATWTLTGSNSGSVSGLTNNLTFSNVAKITGGSANDTFVFASGVNFNGNIDGGAGFDTLDYANYGESVTVDLIGGTATGTLGIANIENAILFVDNKLEATPIPVTLVETSGKIVIPYTILANNSPLPSLITDADLPRGSRNFSSADVALRTFDSKFSNAFRQYIASDSGGNAANISEKGVNDNLNSSDPDPFDRSSEDSNSENSEEARKQEITLARAQDSLNAVYLATGVKPALLYIIFVPPLGNAENAPESNRDRLMLLFVPPQGDAIVRPLPINRELAVKVAHRFRRRVTNKRRPTAFMTPAQKLYSWLIEPIAADLKAREIQHLTFLLDSQLRSLPIAALHNGENFLVEDYSLSVMPSLALTDLSYANVRNMSLLAMGAETFQDQKPLPAAGAEVEILTEQLWKGESYLNENFSVETLLEARQENAFPLIHLATHGQFTSGSPDNSFISLGNDKLSLSQIRKLGLHDPPVELLVLSACQTALGDVQAELGFAGLAVLAGVKSALGSLWKVDDTGTLLLMTTFYKQLKEAPIKAEALRRSQISMIRGETQLGDGEIVTTSGTISLDQKLTGGRDLSHPYFWSGFTLIGTPW